MNKVVRIHSGLLVCRQVFQLMYSRKQKREPVHVPCFKTQMNCGIKTRTEHLGVSAAELDEQTLFDRLEHFEPLRSLPSVPVDEQCLSSAWAMRWEGLGPVTLWFFVLVTSGDGHMCLI